MFQPPPDDEKIKIMAKIKIVFLDRDGVINVSAPPHMYVTKWEEFEYLPGVYEAIKILNESGFIVIVITNQRCIARNIATKEDVKELNRKMLNDIKKHGGKIDKVYCCPHDIDEHCDCRKPKPGLFIKAEKALKRKGYTIDKDASWMIGDSITDIKAGQNYGVNTIQIAKNTEHNEIKLMSDKMHFTAPDLKSAAEMLSFL